VLKRLAAILAVGIAILVTGTMVIQNVNLYQSKTIRHIDVSEASTDWYSTGSILGITGDRLEIDVNSVGGSAKLRVDTQNGEIIFPEVQNNHLQYEVVLPSDDTYLVVIWTRAFPFPSNYVSLQGTINQQREVLELYPIGYVEIAVMLSGLFIISSGVLVYIRELRFLKEEKSLRICPFCNRKTAINKPICQYCGYDVTKSVRCKHCYTIYDSSLYKCPNCGAYRE
jgi:hypothetical protein